MKGWECRRETRRWAGAEGGSERERAGQRGERRNETGRGEPRVKGEEGDGGGEQMMAWLEGTGNAGQL